MKSHPTAVIHPDSKIAGDVEIGPYCVIERDVRIESGTRIDAHSVIKRWTEIGKNCRISSSAVLGGLPQDVSFKGHRSFVKVGDNTTIREYVTIHRASKENESTVVGNDCFLMAYSHVGHDCEVGDGVIITNYTGLSGHVIIEDFAVLSGMVGIHQFVRIGKMAMIGGFTRLTEDFPPVFLAEGNPVRVHGINAIGLRRNDVSKEVRNTLKKAYRFLYRSNLNVKQALERIRGELECDEINHLIHFIENSKRGICGRKIEGDIKK